MKDKDIRTERFVSSGTLQTLRQKAEVFARDNVTPSNEVTQKALDELYIHQLELEMQNEELKRVYEELDAERLKASQEQKVKLEAIINSISDGLIILDKNEEFSFLNQKGRDLFYLPDTITKNGDGFKYTQYYDIQGKKLSVEDMVGSRVLKGEKVKDCTIKVVRPDKTVYFSVSGNPVLDSQGSITSAVIYCRDVTEKTLMEEALKESEAKYKDLFNNMQLGAVQYKIITDDFNTPIDYSIMEVNPAYERITNLKRHEIIGKKATELFPGIENSSVDWIEIFGEIALTGKSVSREVYSDITNRWYDTFCYCPKPGYTAGIFSDITARKKNEEELKITEKRLLEAQEFARLGYWELDVFSGVYYWSDETFRIFGFKPQALIPTVADFLNIVHPDERDFMINVIKDPLNGHGSELDFRIIRQDNEIIWLHVKTRYEYDASGMLVRRYGIIQDITPRKLSEIKLKESEEKFKELADNLAQVIWVRQEEEFIYINPAYEKIWGRTCQSLYDNPNSFIEFIHPDDKERVKQAYIGDKRTSKGLFDEQFKIIRPDGGIRWVWDRTLPIYNENGKIIRVLGISDDITEIKEYEESLRQSAEEAENANKAKSQFLANMSHEIRTPMNGILGMSQLLVLDLQDEQKEMATMIKTSGDNLLTIINDILDFSKIEAGKVRLSHEAFDINTLVKEVDDLIKPLIVRKGLEYISHIDKEINDHLIGDSGRLKQILINLLGNAIKFTESGSVELSVVKGKVFQDRVQLIFSIKDTGIGIAEDKIGQLFTFFTQGDDSVTKKYGGTGLGLAISKQLINMMDGEISVESELGVGSNFSFNAIFMQVKDEKELNKVNIEDAPTVAETNCTALLVEDDYVSGLVMKKLCERRKINLKIATSSKQALNILKDENFDIIFMDIQMPDISGYKTTEIIRDMEKELHRYTPIIATTAFALVGDREKCIDAGMDDYLGKPIDAEKFYAIVEKHLQR